ncbi:MAG: hypothetical protein LBD64_06190 [Odoribacteraceae bacterium]|jgi:hypothetical protein|nr:hypothetical protein [Odoribacteraceae bacterium]
MKTLYVLLLGGLLVATVAPASARRDPRYTIAMQPFQAINGTARFDLEKRLSEKEWIQLGLAMHTVTRRGNEIQVTLLADDHEINRLRGAGATLKYKYFFHRWFYYAAAVDYNRYRVRYNDNVMHTYKEDGLTFHEYLENIDTRQDFNKFSTSFTVGLQSSVSRVFFVDVFAGLGYAYSFYDEDKESFGSSIFSAGHRGTFPACGLRFGIAF